MSWQQEIAALEEAHRRAFLERDVERVASLWSDQLLVNSPLNRVNDKQQLLALLRAGTSAHSEMDERIDVVERRKDLVVVMGSERIVNAPGGPAFHRRFTNVWRQEDGSWRLLLRHANIIAAS